MNFPLAFAGVKRLFTSEVLRLLATAASLISGIAALIVLLSLPNETQGGMIGGSVAAMVFNITSAVLLVVAYIYKLIGLNKAAYDEPKFRQAFILAIFALVLSVTASAFDAFNVGNGIVDNIVLVVATIAEIIITIYVIQGVKILAVKMENKNVADIGTKLMVIVVVFYILSLIANLIPVFFGAEGAAEAISEILAIAGSILSIVANIVFIVYLSKARDMLEVEY